MKPRLAIVSMLAAGALMAFGGTGLAISGISGSNDASVAQYIDETEAVEQVEATEAVEEAPEAVQPARQVGVAEDRALPFTGLAAIPLIAVGIGLMIGGLAVRRRARPTE